ncbi:MAG: hypothetical protein LBS99_00375, partial [Clostridiales bacterium]|nr:hypothetical protein [Clostridiales bacterium]
MSAGAKEKTVRVYKKIDPGAVKRAVIFAVCLAAAAALLFAPVLTQEDATVDVAGKFNLIAL